MTAKIYRKKKNESKKEQMFNFMIDIELKKLYQEFCLKKGYSLGKRMRSLIKYDMEGKAEI